jgi:hypothetical protein
MFNMVVLPFHCHLPFPIQPVHSQPYILIHLQEWQMLSHKLEKITSQYFPMYGLGGNSQENTSNMGNSMAI